MRDAQRLGHEGDAVAVAKLERFGLELTTGASLLPPPRSAGDLYALWLRSPLAEDEYPVVLGLWSRTGRQLFFETLDNRVMVAGYTAQGNSFVAEKPRLWSERQLSNLSNTSRNIDVAPDGKRFAVILPVEQPGSQQAKSRVTFIENFFDELRRRVPAGK